MKTKKTRIILFSLVAGIVLLILWNSFSQPGIQDLQGDFRRVAFYKNENNTGPVQRVYAVTTSDTLWQEMKKYGDFMPHTKYGRTVVYFFSDSQPAPEQLSPGKDNVDPQYYPNCLAKYEKDPMGQIAFTRFPFR